MADAELIRIGSIVRLIGIRAPEMVVHDIVPLKERHELRCVWFNTRNEVMEQFFSPSVVEIVHHPERTRRATRELPVDRRPGRP